MNRVIIIAVGVVLLSVGACGGPTNTNETASTPQPAPDCKLASQAFVQGVLGLSGKVGYVPQSNGVWYVVADGFPEGDPQAWSIWATASNPSADPFESGITFPATRRARQRSETGAAYVAGRSHPPATENDPPAIRVSRAADDLTAGLAAARSCVDLLK